MLNRRRLLLTSVVVIVLVLLSAPWGVLADRGDSVASSPVDLTGTWYVSLHWTNPEIITTWIMTVHMFTSNVGLISNEYGDYGILLTNGDKTLWTVGIPWIVTYVGTVWPMGGVMFNRDGNYGDWTAVKISASQPHSASGGAGATLGVQAQP